MGKVSIVKIKKDIKSSLNDSLNLIGGLSCFINKEDIVLIKPNLNDFESYTSIELTEALIQLLIDHSVKKIFIGEATFGNEKMTGLHFKKSGYYDLAKKYNIVLFNFNKSEITEIDVKNPFQLNKLKIAKEVFSATKIINLPVMKVHYATGITVALKNLKGMLVGDEKRHFHETGLDKAIVDLNNNINIDLNIVDCISCMETMGPKGGDIFSLDMIISGKNRGDVDIVCSKIMGYALDEVKHLKYYCEHNNINFDNIEVLGEKLKDVIHPFKKVNMKKIIPDLINVYNKDACSSCENALLLSLRILEEKVKQATDIYLGSNINLINNKNTKIAFGNCCKNNKLDKFIKGCPPYPFELKKILEE
jgi:uncharacterized protein (DUF362 family)